MAIANLTIDGLMVFVSEGRDNPTRFGAVAELLPAFPAMAVACSVAVGANMTFVLAPRGAGDTRSVSVLTFLLAWPILMVPTSFLV